MKQTINFSQFVDAFNDRRPNTFTYDGLHALFDYLEELEDSTGEEVEFDLIALCCEFIEYESAEEYAKDYNDDLEDWIAVETRSGSYIVYSH